MPRSQHHLQRPSRDDRNTRLATPPPRNAGDPARPARVEIDARFHQLVYDAVRSIPEGRVSSYGRIANLIGHPKHSRHVGAALKLLPRHLAHPHLPHQPRQSDDHDEQEEEDEEELLPPPEPNPLFVPWHRVVSSSGQISARMNEVSITRQAEWLIAEGVQVDDVPAPRELRQAGVGTAGDQDHQVFDGAGPEAWGFRGVHVGGKVKMSEYAWP